jgi:hypothetical protein
MTPNFFSYSKLKNIITFDSEGLLTMVEDAEPEDGVTSIIDIPKTKIQKPGLDESTVPKLGGREAMGFCVIQANKESIDSMIPMLPDHIMKRIKMESEPTEAEHME